MSKHDQDPASRSQQVRQWYDENAERYRDVVALEHAFTELTPEQQSRLNHFKLWHLEQDQSLSLAGKRVLEFGAGHGRLALEMQGYAEYVGVDFSVELVRIGRERLARAGLSDRARLEAADCLEYEGPANHFDIVCSLGMFAYVEDEQKILRKMAHHLRPGGVLFFDGHIASALYDPLRKLRWRFSTPTGGTSRLFRHRELAQLFRGAGITDVRIVMREYPLLGDLYARRGWDWALGLRNSLAARPWLDFLATDFLAVGRKPERSAVGGNA
ncbi:MAG TPA: methyltransferase domain-containing protein [Gemmatimonadaceae bacterium]|nr:methyltransferase domain-containing protein [Gemmatimonadaceae bacterium]